MPARNLGNNLISSFGEEAPHSGRTGGGVSLGWPPSLAPPDAACPLPASDSAACCRSAGVVAKDFVVQALAASLNTAVNVEQEAIKARGGTVRIKRAKKVPHVLR